MVIVQKSIRNLSKLSSLEKGAVIRIGVSQFEQEKAIQMGFQGITTGETVLPAVCGSKTRLNAEGTFEIHRDRPKETAYRMAEWTRKEFRGRDITEEVTETVIIPYKRYPRTAILPLAIEWTIAEIEGKQLIVSHELEYGKDDNKIVLAINVILEIFGVCEVFTEDLKPHCAREVRRLNWEVLPKGEYPWEVQKERLTPFFSRARGKNKNVVSRRNEFIVKYEPDFTAIGRGGFRGYVVHAFKEKDIYILESYEVNNATYVLNGNWETISMLSKADILRNELHQRRIIHDQNWSQNIRALLA